MRKIACLLLAVAGNFALMAQRTGPGSNETKVTEIEASNFKITPPLRDLAPVTPEAGERIRTIGNKLRRNPSMNPNALPVGPDPLWQKTMGSRAKRAPIQNWEGINQAGGGGATPPDPSGAASETHYIQMVNTAYQIFDKEGNSLYGPSELSNLWASSVNDGDPIVMYDRFAKRWFMSQFQQSGNKILIAISQTSDPLGSYYTYEFGLAAFPDYPKYSIWHDGYYMTANSSDDNLVIFERDKMLAGDQSAKAIKTEIPNLERNGFFSALPADAEGASFPSSGPCYLFFMQDDDWSNSLQADELRIWEVDVDWNNTANTTVGVSANLPVSPFESEFAGGSWNDIEQPGSAQKLDGVPTALMYRAPFRSFGSYNAVVLNHTVDVNGQDRAAIRWYELRQTNGNWEVFQEGTYAPDDQERWMASIGMDSQGNIGMAYSVSGSTVYPSIRYTGRYAGDEKGKMTLAEETIVDGSGTQSGTNRFGDYAHLVMDPDDFTFWYTGEYIPQSGNWNTRIASFQIFGGHDKDVGVSTVTAPTDGSLSNAETVTITVRNYGTDAQSNFPVSYKIGSGSVVTETFSGSLASGASQDFSFAQKGDFGAVGVYDVMAWTGLSGDAAAHNDTIKKMIEHLAPYNIGVVSINKPTSGTGLGSENIEISIQNFGANSVSGYDVAFSVDGGNEVVENVAASLAPGATAAYTFTTAHDFSAFKTHQVAAYTKLGGDSNLSNDTVRAGIDHTACIPTADCSYGDAIMVFELNTINNNSGCEDGGYSDFTDVSTDLELGKEYQVSVTADYEDQKLTIWIDGNDNGQFEVSEQVVTNFAYDNSGSTSFTLTGVPLGAHKMRVRNRYDDPSDDPCEDYEYGETEDYSVNVTEPVGIEESLLNALALTARYDQDESLFIVDMSGVQGDFQLEVINALGQRVFETPTQVVASGKQVRINASDFAPGHYAVVVRGKKAQKLVKLMKI